ncbi:BadM/Rrf2 family transcriptional regulator [Nitrospirillum amazonense]|uniref:BadM/Rrf2 family transcriptional regulator n=1 Tax=Nitrospirillum amazonense TaxID=28077 RepID=A0A560ER83_9PROT|nr:Rrf2 family transcriptional regulator [Nitrospirillum amazonense]TWB11879.1 BadM/Rrf2 family transcriptional regulator [Nitrospirillum amazonense]
MSKDSRLARMAHVLVHMAFNDGAATSDTIARMLNTNPVVVRRTMAGLRDRGYVASEKGPRGGWRLTRPLENLTLLDVHQALETASVFTIGPSDGHVACAVERMANRAITGALNRASAALEAALGQVRLSDILAEGQALRAAMDQGRPHQCPNAVAAQ